MEEEVRIPTTLVVAGVEAAKLGQLPNSSGAGRGGNGARYQTWATATSSGRDSGYYAGAYGGSGLAIIRYAT